MPRWNYVADRKNWGCSKVYAPRRDRERGKARMGDVCFQDGKPEGERWRAQVAARPGAEQVSGWGSTRDGAVSDALSKTLAKWPPVDALYTLREVEEMTGIARRTLTNWITAGSLPNLGPTSVALVRCVDVVAAADRAHTVQNREGARKCL